MKSAEYTGYDATDLARIVATGEVSPLELLEAAETRTNDLNESINAVVTRMPVEARAFLQDLPRGAFAGVPFLLKDLNQMYRGVRTSNGSALFSDFVADHDSTLVRRYKAAGLVICGKTNTPEFGLATTTEPRLHGPTRNPWNIQYSPGGSSGGAAAAVAAGIVPAAHATDGGGSIRIPASCCGLFGLKPTRARTPSGPSALEGWGGLSCGHAITRSVRDSAALLDATAGAETGSPYFAPPMLEPFTTCLTIPLKHLRVGICAKAFNGSNTDTEVRDIANAAALKLEALGHTIETVDVEVAPETVRAAHGILAVSHVGATIEKRGRDLGRNVTEDDVEEVTWNNYQMSQQITGAMYAQAVGDIHQLGRTLETYFENYDLLLTPTMARKPPRIGEMDMMGQDAEAYLAILYAMIGYTSLANDTGHPACSLPMGMSRDGLPVGVQLIAAFGNERLLFQVAQQIEAAGLFVPLQVAHA